MEEEARRDEESRLRELELMEERAVEEAQRRQEALRVEGGEVKREGRGAPAGGGERATREGRR